LTPALRAFSTHHTLCITARAFCWSRARISPRYYTASPRCHYRHARTHQQFYFSSFVTVLLHYYIAADGCRRTGFGAHHLCFRSFISRNLMSANAHALQCLQPCSLYLLAPQMPHAKRLRAVDGVISAVRSRNDKLPMSHASFR